MRGTGAGIGSFTPNAVALYDSFLKLGSVAEDGVLIANVGDENTDVAIVLGPDLAFARNLSGGGRLFTDAIRQRFGVDDEQAEEMKRTLANLSPNAKGRYTSPQEEKVTNAMLGPAGQFASLLQSTAALAKAQLKLPELKIQRALLCGGGSRLLGFGEYLAATTGWQVQLFDPLESMELGSLPTEERAELERDRFEAVVALGLALASAETGLYRLDILPEAIVRKRRFLERTSFVIAAVVLAAGYLGAEAYFTSALATDARTTANAVSREVKQRQAVNDKTLEILGDPNNGVPGRNAELAEIATELEVRAAAGASLLAVDRALRNLLPSDLWITKEIMKIDRDAARPDLGAKDLPSPDRPPHRQGARGGREDRADLPELHRAAHRGARRGPRPNVQEREHGLRVRALHRPGSRGFGRGGQAQLSESWLSTSTPSSKTTKVPRRGVPRRRRLLRGLCARRFLRGGRSPRLAQRGRGLPRKDGKRAAL